MKIKEIISDLKRLNSLLPEDPIKNYANPLARMALELQLIREFALSGDQKYVSAQLELTSKSAFDLFPLNCQVHKKARKIHLGKSPKFQQKLSTANQKGQVFFSAMESQNHNRNVPKMSELTKMIQVRGCKKVHQYSLVYDLKNSIPAPFCCISVGHILQSNPPPERLPACVSFYLHPSFASISVDGVNITSSETK